MALLIVNAQEAAFDFAASRDGETVAVQISDGTASLRLEMDPDAAAELSAQLRCLSMKGNVLRARAAGAEPPVIIGDNIPSIRALRDREAA